ncbi:hypothetical protein [Cytobacillus oceanisediminis]|uniref:hypothetical protein n=1 Tax=Cytobacillus oceanisediminis TaxID=665099 RepID=UPI00215B20B1|nr:hypothetical protein [Cytobacillus oceanisediminis]
MEKNYLRHTFNKKLMNDIMGEFRSVTEYAGDFTVIMTLSALFIIGCIGYIAVLDIKRNRSLKKLSVHT